MADEITATSYDELVSQTGPSANPEETICRVDLKLAPLEAGIILCPDLGRALAMKRLGVPSTSPSRVIMIKAVVDRVAQGVEIYWEKVQ